MRQQLGKLEAQITILTQHNESMREQTEHERKQTRAILRELQVITESLSDVVEIAVRLERALMRIETPPTLLRGVDMARRVGLSPDELRRRTEAGDIPGYQSVELGHWRYDPAEVVEAIKSSGRALVC